MTPQDFDKQMGRLKSQWGNSYGEERARILFQTFREVEANIFQDAVTECLMRYRQAPLTDEINREVEQARSRQKERAWQRSDRSILGVLQHAADSGKAANPDHVAACMRLVAGHGSKYSKEQFDQGVAVLEQACGLGKPTMQSMRGRRDHE